MLKAPPDLACVERSSRQFVYEHSMRPQALGGAQRQVHHGFWVARNPKSSNPNADLTVAT
jgi:hypothetical protein